MKTRLQKTAVTLAVAACLGISSVASAAETSSGMRGKIVGPSGQPALNTKITIIHQPSGTIREVETNEVGLFSVKGLRVGGPYTIVVNSDEYQDTLEEGISIQLGDTKRLSFQLAAKSSIETIQITGSAVGFDSSGAASSFGQEDIARAPAFNRDLKDIVRNNPMAVVDEEGGLSFGGSNPKFNSITVDGIGQNDDFGLNESGYPSNRSPISLDAVDQIAVDSSPFSSSVGGFSGGTVNVVTKSGTNEFKGSTFFEMMSEDMAGEPKDSKSDNPGSSNFNVGEQKTTGFTVGGPLIKDELFFFFSAEKFNKVTPVAFGIDEGSPSKVTEAEYNEFVTIMDDVYGIQDGVNSGDPEESDDKFLVKLDWNINDSHRADFTYQYQSTAEDKNTNDYSNSLNMDSHGYIDTTSLDNYAVHLYSDWNDDFSTEVSIAYKDSYRESETNSDFGQVSVRTDSGTINAGQDVYRQGNISSTKTWSYKFGANYLTGDHDIKFGASFEALDLYNLFSKESMGVWEFDSLEDFASGNISSFSYSNAYTNDTDDASYTYESSTLALYIEDTWTVDSDLDVTFGVRYERLGADTSASENDSFNETYGMSNTATTDGLDILLPRVGFKYYLNDDMIIRGGIGKFSGGKPNIWAVPTDGVTYVSATQAAEQQVIENGKNDPSSIDFHDVPDVAQDSLQQGAGSTTFLDPNYKISSDWRYQLGLDWTLDIPKVGEDFKLTVEMNYVDRQDATVWEDVSRIDNGKTTADGGRIIYDSVYEGTDQEGNSDIMMTNIDDGGRSLIFTTSLQKIWDNGVRMNMSYTHQDITEANPGTSSQAESNYQYNVGVNKNESQVGTAYYEVAHRFVLNLGYTAQFVDGYNTNIDLFFERRSGRPYSATMDTYGDTSFGDQYGMSKSQTYLPYIPTGPDDSAVDWDNSTYTYDELMALYDEAGVNGEAGGYADKYSETQPWVTTLDLNVTQEFKGFQADQKGMAYFTVDNLANLLNSDWGQVHTMGHGNNAVIGATINDDGQYILTEAYGLDTNNYDTFNQSESTWRIKLGVRYTF